MRRIQAISRFSAWVAGSLTVPMMVTVFLDAALRGLFGFAMDGVAEANSFLLVAMIYLGLAGAQSQGANFRMTLVIDRMPPWLETVAVWLVQLVLIVLVSVMLWFCTRAAIYSYQRDEVSFGLIEIPLWPSRGIISVGLGLLLVQYVSDVIRYWREGVSPLAAEAHSSEQVDPESSIHARDRVA